jgi:hypothetical protein
MRVRALSGLPAALVATAAAVALMPATASAEFSQASLLSGAARFQFEEANAPVLSADGRYAVFQGELEGVPGIFRRDLQSGEVEMVAGAFALVPGASLAEQALNAPDATAPSVSAEGRYVAFTSAADLDPGEEPSVDRGCPEVYVRDLELPPTAPGAYALASALDRTSTGIEYEGGCPASTSSGFQVAGAQAAAGVALSGDGLQIAFTVLSKSNLAGSGTPPSQVAVRDLETGTTTLVSVTPGGEATPGGGAFPSEESEDYIHEGITSTSYGDELTASSAAIDAEGNTVAWLGTNVPAQVPSSAAELESGKGPSFAGRNPLASEAEPLWRRITDGPATSTRRLLAGAGIDFFSGLAAEESDPVLTGSLVGEHHDDFVPPVLSADGDTVAMVASAPTPAGEATYQRSGLSALSTDAYVVHVSEGPGSAPAVTALTTIPDYAASHAAVEDVKDVAISADGTKVAFDTKRTQFDLPSLALISPPTTFTDFFQTYAANLALGTLQRVTTTYDGAEPNGSAGLLAFSGDGQTLAFASQATDLFFGDAVNASEVYTARELSTEAVPAPEVIGSPPAQASQAQDWTLSVSATAEADGSVLVFAQTPGAGRLAVTAGSQLPPPVKRSALRSSPRAGARKATHASAAKASGKKVKQGKAKTNKGMTVLVRTVARAAATTSAPAEVRLRLRVGAAYRKLIVGANGLYAVLRVTFTAPGHKTLLEELPVTFRLKSRKPAARRTEARKQVKR